MKVPAEDRVLQQPLAEDMSAVAASRTDISLRQRNLDVRVSGHTAANPGLRDGGAERGADVTERGVDGAGQLAHASGGTESDQSDDQGIFDQILTFFTSGQILELNKELEEQGIHFLSFQGLDY